MISDITVKRSMMIMVCHYVECNPLYWELFVYILLDLLVHIMPFMFKTKFAKKERSSEGMTKKLSACIRI